MLAMSMAVWAGNSHCYYLLLTMETPIGLLSYIKRHADSG